jgi:DNA-binding beta-propeller fold protein YncE
VSSFIGSLGDRSGVLSSENLRQLQPFGQGSGTLVINATFTGRKISCTAQMLSFCGDDPSRLDLDPASSNIFFADQDTNEISIGHIDFSTSTLLATSSSIPGVLDLFFSPDSKVVYAVDLNNVYVYAFNPTSGDFTASSSFARQSGAVYIATTTLHIQ